MLLKSYIIDRYLESPKPQKPRKKKSLGDAWKTKKPKKQNFEEHVWF